MGVRVQFHDVEVTDCTEIDDGVMLIAGLEHHAFDSVFLALGDLPSTDYTEFLGLPNYVHSIWEPSRMDGIAPEARVGILGTSLTAVDVLLSLDERSHVG